MEVQNKKSMRQHCALKHGILKEFLAEFLGTFVLVVSKNVLFSIETFLLFFCSENNIFAVVSHLEVHTFISADVQKCSV